MSTTPADTPEFSGSRSFRYVRPKGKKATEYEEISLHIQHDPVNFAHLGWPMRFVGGAAPYDDSTTRMRSSDWWAFSDPSKVLYRTYVAMQAAQEETLDGLVEMHRSSGDLAALDGTWVNEIVGMIYSATACLEWGLFRALAAAQRDARSDVISFAMVFNAGDKLRHAHDIALYDVELAESRPDFSSTRGRDAWMDSPLLQPLRRLVEQIMYTHDWLETIVAVNCALEPRVGALLRKELLLKHGAVNGDGVTPLIVATAERDWLRNQRWTDELVRMLLADAEHGEKNRAVFGEWIEKWSAAADEACVALRPVWDLPPRRVDSFDAALVRCQTAAEARIRGLVDA